LVLLAKFGEQITTGRLAIRPGGLTLGGARNLQGEFAAKKQAAISFQLFPADESRLPPFRRDLL
jgi:hypothetical protein